MRALLVLASIVAQVGGLRGSTQGGYQPPSAPPSTSNQTSTLAIVTLLLGILSWTLLPGVAAWGGVITGWIELNNIKKGESAASNKTITQIGFWASVANVGLQFLGGCAAAALFLIYGAAFLGMLGLGAAAG